MHALGLLAGVLLALWAPAVWSTLLAWMVVCFSAALLATRWWRIGLLTAVGFFLAQHCAARVLQAAFDCGERRLVVARIETVPAATGSGWQFDATVEPARPPGLAPLRARLTWRTTRTPHVGEHWQYLIQFATPAASERGASQARNLLRDHISATASVRESPL